MPKLKILSGKDIVEIFISLGFAIAGQKGSHVKLKRYVAKDSMQTLTIPLHVELDKGTLKAIYRQALRYIPQNELMGYFYSE